MANYPLLILAPVLYLLAWIFTAVERTVKARRRVRALPTFPGHSKVWGHLPIMPKYRFDTIYFHYALHGMYKAYPEEIFVLDLEPFSRPIVVLNTIELAEQVANSSPEYPYSLPKADAYIDYLPALGEKSLIWISGEEWKRLRKQFNPGFQPQHLSTLIPEIVDATITFDAVLQKNVGQVVKFTKLASGVTIDIIGQVLFEKKLNAQVQDPALITLHQKVVDLCFRTDELSPLYRMNILRPFKRWYYTRKLDGVIRDLIIESQATGVKSSQRSIVTLAMKDSDGSEAAMQACIDQVKTFFFAGHDTTATMLSWLVFELWKHPEVRTSLCAEHDKVLGSAIEGREERAAQLIREKSDAILGELTYTNACIKETLRLHPRASSSRQPLLGTSFTIHHKGKSYAVENSLLSINQCTIQRNKQVFGEDAESFRPERWLEPGFDPGKWYRPFEQNHRNCIGQNLTMLEAKIILALIIRKYKFEKVGMDGIDDEEVYDMRTVAAYPVDSMVMRVLKA